MPRIKVRATVRILGLNAGEQAEIDLTEKARTLILSGYLRALRPKSG